MFPLDCEIGARLADKVMAVDIIMPAGVLVFSRSK